MKFSIKIFYCRCDQIVDLVKFTEEIINGKLHFRCSEMELLQVELLNSTQFLSLRMRHSLMDKIVERLFLLDASFLVNLIRSTAKLVTNSLREIHCILY